MFLCRVCNEAEVDAPAECCQRCADRTKRGIRRDRRYIPDGKFHYVPVTAAYNEYKSTPSTLRKIKRHKVE